MKAVVTGASSGLGREFAKYLDSLGYELFLVARDKEELENTSKELKNKSKIIVMDLSDFHNLKSLYVLLKNEDIDVLINNAGFGIFGEFCSTDITEEVEMINLNITGVHILTKLFLKDMKKRGSGYILNVSSSASFFPGPLMSGYYASKAYVTRLTEAISYELKKEGSPVKVSCLCPGPVKTNFNKRAGVEFSVSPLEACDVAKYAITQMLRGKCVIIPGTTMKLAKFFSRFASDNFIMGYVYKIQKAKQQK